MVPDVDASWGVLGVSDRTRRKTACTLRRCRFPPELGDPHTLDSPMRVGVGFSGGKSCVAWRPCWQPGFPFYGLQCKQFAGLTSLWVRLGVPGVRRRASPQDAALVRSRGPAGGFGRVGRGVSNRD